MCLSSKNIEKQLGFGLLEVLVAIVVLSVSAVAFIKLQHVGMKEIKNTTMRTEAVRVMSNVIEAFKANKSLRDNMMVHDGNNIWATDARERSKLDVHFRNFVKCSEEDQNINASPSSWCSPNDAWKYQELMIRRYLSTDLMVQDGSRSGLCIRKGKGSNYRFTIVWKKVTENNFDSIHDTSTFDFSTYFGMSDCPGYNDKNKFRETADAESVDMYVRF